ncbi:hypothetical protein ABZ054_14840, partial [Streptomyces sp. NPDC006324]
QQRERGKRSTHALYLRQVVRQFLGETNRRHGLQNLTILVAAPFVLVMIGMCVALMRDLRRDPLIVRGEMGEEAVELAVIAGHEKYAGDFELRIGPGEPDQDGPGTPGRGGS